MIGKRVTFAAVLCALLLTAFQSACRANTVQIAECSGDITEDNVTNMAFYALVEKITFTGTTEAPSIGGQVCFAGRTGNLTYTGNAVPLSAAFSTATTGGVTYAYATITTHPFACLNLATGKSVEALMTVYLTTSSAGARSVAFQIFNQANGSLIAQTVAAGAPNVLGALTLSGAEFILNP